MMKQHSSGPPIEARFYVTPKGIAKVELKLLNPSQKFIWQIIEEAPSRKTSLSVQQWIEAYCSGSKELPHIPVVIENLPPYTREVLKYLHSEPYTKRFTYQELASLTGKERAARAVGNACGRNPCPLIIPCHHVFAVQGLGGFAFGLAMKKTLLAFET